MIAIVRRSWLTLTVFGITATTSLLQVFVPGVLTELQRTPAIRDGEVWRIVTSLLVQDGGWLGTISNLLFLLAVGIAAELVLPRWLWLLCYLCGGLIGQLAGLVWQPVGAGNSVAVCGLAGALALTLIRGTNPSRRTAWIVTWWCAALAATISWTAFFTGAAVAMVAQFAIVLLGSDADRLRSISRVLGYAVLAYALVLIVNSNVHGPPLLVGAAVALIPHRVPIAPATSSHDGPA